MTRTTGSTSEPDPEATRAYDLRAEMAAERQPPEKGASAAADSPADGVAREHADAEERADAEDQRQEVRENGAIPSGDGPRT